MYLNGKIIGQTIEGYDIFVEYDKHCKSFIYTVAEYSDNGEITQVYGLYPTVEGGFTFQSGKPVEIVSGC